MPLSRAQLARNQRNRARNAATAAANAADEAQERADVRQQQQHDASDDDTDSDDGAAAGRTAFDGAERMGAKKRAKLEAKAEKRAHREAELLHREDRKKRDEVAAEERRAADERERLAEQRQEEAERAARELKERQEHEEYVRMRAAFSVEEEGFDEEEEAGNLLQQFVEHIRTRKVVLLEELARTFRLKTPAVIERIQELKADGTLTGVLDDRGKFIYITPDELAAVATFIRQRGRVSISELAESSNNLIGMAAAATATEAEA